MLDDEMDETLPLPIEAPIEASLNHHNKKKPRDRRHAESQRLVNDNRLPWYTIFALS